MAVPGDVLINCGSHADFNSSVGLLKADANLTNDNSTDRGGVQIANTLDDVVFNTLKFGNLVQYTIAVQNGAWDLALWFAETWVGIGVGGRLMNIKVNGFAYLTNFDVYQQAGGTNKAFIRTLPVDVVDGTVNLEIRPSVPAGANAFVNGIVLTQADPIPPTLINPGKPVNAATTILSQFASYQLKQSMAVRALVANGINPVTAEQVVNSLSRHDISLVEAMNNLGF